MILALFGPTLVGKTTIGRALAASLEYPLRSCGDAVRKTSVDLGVAHNELSNEQHQIIDEETRAWVIKNQPCVVEGRFLDHVLASLAYRLPQKTKIHQLKRRTDSHNDTPDDRRHQFPEIIFFNITSSQESREKRFSESNIDRNIEIIKRSDEEDVAFRFKCYGNIECIKPCFTVDSSDRTVESCVRHILNLLE